MNVFEWLANNPVRIGTAVAIVAGAISKLAEGGGVQWYEVLAAVVVALTGEVSRSKVRPTRSLH